MEGQPTTILINVQGDMIGNTVAGILDTIDAKAAHLGLDKVDMDRLLAAIQSARDNPPDSHKGREALKIVKAVLEHAGGAVLGHGIVSQLARFLH
jgi:hypothetical protein